jgi:hypothetical protein
MGSVDAHGVAFAAIQGLNEKLQGSNKKLADEVKSLRARLATKDEEGLKLKARLAAIEKKLGL